MIFDINENESKSVNSHQLIGFEVVKTWQLTSICCANSCELICVEVELRKIDVIYAKTNRDLIELSNFNTTLSQIYSKSIFVVTLTSIDVN
jgi:hypothetical protein